jgi:hypothetical protein
MRPSSATDVPVTHLRRQCHPPLLGRESGWEPSALSWRTVKFSEGSVGFEASKVPVAYDPSGMGRHQH